MKISLIPQVLVRILSMITIQAVASVLMSMITIRITTRMTVPMLLARVIVVPAVLTSSQNAHNVAVIVSSSTFFHNYRHTTNALTLYHALKQYGGYTDDHILLFLGDEVACNARNPFKNQIPYSKYTQSGAQHDFDLFENNNVQVDYSGKDVTVENFFRVLVGRHEQHTPKHQQMPPTHHDTTTDASSNLLIYITGHGGDNFFKFRDDEDFTTLDFRAIMEQLQINKRFHSILFISDTCQAFTLAPNTKEMERHAHATSQSLSNVYSVGSSLKDQSSYAHHSDPTIGHSVIDRYMFHFLDYMDGNHHQTTTTNTRTTTTYDNQTDNRWSHMNDITLKEALVDSMYLYNSQGYLISKKLGVDVGYSDYGCDLQMDQVPMSDFFVMKKQHQQQQLQHDICDDYDYNSAYDDCDDDATLILDQVDFWA